MAATDAGQHAAGRVHARQCALARARKALGLGLQAEESSSRVKASLFSGQIKEECSVVMVSDCGRSRSSELT